MHIHAHTHTHTHIIFKHINSHKHSEATWWRIAKSDQNAHYIWLEWFIDLINYYHCWICYLLFVHTHIHTNTYTHITLYVYSVCNWFSQVQALCLQSILQHFHPWPTQQVKYLHSFSFLCWLLWLLIVRWVCIVVN